MEKVFTDDMAEITGLGGLLEQGARNMLLAGIAWVEMYPKADPQFEMMTDRPGSMREKNQDAIDLMKDMRSHFGEGGPSAEMIEATVAHLMFVKQHGWERYTEVSKDRRRIEDEQKVKDEELKSRIKDAVKGLIGVDDSAFALQLADHIFQSIKQNEFNETVKKIAEEEVERIKASKQDDHPTEQ